MRVSLKELLEKLGVRHEMAAYETHPWFLYDEEKGITCNAEVRMGPGLGDLEAEVQILRDELEPLKEEPPPKKDDKEDKDRATAKKEEAQTTSEDGLQTQIMIMRAKPHSNDGKWSPIALRVRGKDYANEMYDWEGKGCAFFKGCIQAIQMGEIPDVDALIEKNMDDDSRRGGGRGKIGRKSPKIKPAQLLGMKKGGM